VAEKISEMSKIKNSPVCSVDLLGPTRPNHIRTPGNTQRGAQNNRDRHYKLNDLTTPLELAFSIQDPCGETAIELAREVLKLITDRDDIMSKILLVELHKLNLKYPRYPNNVQLFEYSKEEL
jgi:hypothetical protein